MRELSEQEVIEDIIECERRRGAFNGKIINEEDDLVCKKTIYNKFGSIVDAAEEAGVEWFHPQEKEPIETECGWCGETLERYPNRIENTDMQFCDQECQGQWLSKNVVGEDHPLYEGAGEWAEKFGSMWHKIREKRLEEDDKQCVVCGLTQEEHIERYGRELDVHHVTPRREFYKCDDKTIDDANEIDNLRTLCREHHIKVENGIEAL